MNERTQEREIKNFLRGKIKGDIDAFCLYQWLERCHYHSWWDLGITLGSQIPPSALNQEYRKRLEFLLAECRRNYSEEQSPNSRSKSKEGQPYRYRIRLKVSSGDAFNLLESIHHGKFINSLVKNWQVDEGGFVRAQSVLWLFCWAKTGNGSISTAIRAQEAFDLLFPFTYTFLDSRIDHEWARKMRYSSEDIEQELEILVSY